jgi:superoxide dismutase, Fe-Mn family
MSIHHDKHHAGYVNNLNQALAQYPELQAKTIMQLLADLSVVPEDVRTAVRNNGGGHANHAMFWPSLSAKGGGDPSGALADAINGSFGSLDAFREQFTQAALTRFGSGWAWLVAGDGGLSVMSTPNQDNPISQGLIPLLGLDVWEHAYYLNYQNRRADYVKAWWNVVDWDYVGTNYTAVRLGSGIVQAADWARDKWTQLEAAWRKLSPV